MANAGNHSDTKLIHRMIREEKLIKVFPDDHHVAKRIKERFNHLVVFDERRYSTYLGKKSIGHTAWSSLDKTLIWCNQLRIKYRYFESLKEKAL